MPAEVKTSSLAKKLGARIADAHKQHKDAPVELGMSRLPKGIENGIFQLRTLEFKEHTDGDNKGKLYFRASGSVVKPIKVGDTKVAGMFTSKIIPMYDTPTRGEGNRTFNDHYKKMLNVFKMFEAEMPPDVLPGETKEQSAVRIENALLQAAKVLTAPGKQPYGKLRTWAGDKEEFGQNGQGQWCVFSVSDDGKKRFKRGPYPSEDKAKTDLKNKYVGKDSMVNEDWQGKVDYHPEEANGVVDHDAPDISGAPGTNGDGSVAEAEMSPEPFTEPDQSEPPQDVDTGAEVAAENDGTVPADDTDYSLFDLDTLAGMADVAPDGSTAEAKGAILQLQAQGAAAGLTAEQMTACNNWTELAALIAAPPAAEPAPPADPVKGTIVKYRLRDAKGAPLLGKDKKPAPPVDCEVVSVNAKDRYVTLKNTKTKLGILGDDKKLLKVPYDQIEPE
jgi:hypothetical protein